MKQWSVIIGIILFAGVLDLATTFDARAEEQAASQDKSAFTDSLMILDSLVNNYKVSNPHLAVDFAKKALVIAGKINTQESKARAYQLLGIGYSQNQKDSSFYYFNKALPIVEAENLESLKIHILYNMAMLYKAANDYDKAIMLLDSTRKMAEAQKNYAVVSNAYVAMGNIKLDLHDFESAREMYDTGFKVARDDSLFKQMGVAIANLAKQSFEDNISHSVSILKQALVYLTREKGGKGAEEEIANILINIGNKYSDPDSALFYYKSALDLAVNANLPLIVIGAYNNMAYSYLDKNDTRMAESCLKDYAIPVANQLKDYDWLSSLHDTYADVCIAKGDFKTAVEMQKKAFSERQLAITQRASDQVRLLAALLDLNNKELAIQHEKNRVQKVRLWLVLTLLLVVAAIFVILIMFQRHRVKLQREQIGSARRIIEMEESEKGRIARELHDLTGQLMMGISGSIENIDFPEPEIKQQIKNKIKDLGSSIRKISHRMNRAMIEHFTFSELITGMCEDVQKLSGLSVHLEIPDEFPSMPNELVLHFYRITQELLTNATKYARDSQVIIRIVTESDKIILHYSDDGPGFDLAEKTRSMGIMNINERTKLVGGQAFVTSSPGEGTSWEIIFPTDQKITQ